MKTTITVRIDRFFMPDGEPWEANGGQFHSIGGIGTDAATNESLYLFNNCKAESVELRFADLEAFTGQTVELFVLDEGKMTASGKHKVKVLGYPGGKGSDSQDLKIVATGASASAAGANAAAAAYREGSGGHTAGTPSPIPSRPLSRDDLIDRAIDAMREAATALLALKGSGGRGAAPPEQRSGGEGSAADGEAVAPEPSPSDPRELLLAHFGGGSGVANAYAEHLGGGEAKPIAQMNDDECLALWTIVSAA